jgi:membrane associated rhomboid family serine protease
MNSLLAVLYVIGLYGAFSAGSIHLRAQPLVSTSERKVGRVRSPQATLFLLLIVGIPSILQFFYPVLLVILQRDAVRILNGEWWRLVTSLFVQDGGIPGLSFNLVSLLLVGMVAEQLWNSPLTILIFFVGGIVGEIAGLAWQPIGAGNSVANFSLVGSIVVGCLTGHPTKVVQLIGLLTLGTYILLVALHDIHGAAGTAGMLLALLLSLMVQKQSRVPRDSR